MAGQNKRPKRYDFLEELSMNELDELLRKSGELGQDDEDALVDAIAEVIERKEKEGPTGRLPDVDEAWREFQTHYNTPEGRGASLYPDEDAEEAAAAEPPAAKKRKKPWVRTLVAVAAILVVCFVTVLPPALGYENVFVMVGEWNDAFFRFAASSQDDGSADDPAEETYASLQEALDSNGVTVPIAPQIPSEFNTVMVEVIRYPESGRIDYNAYYQVGQDNMSIYIVQQGEPIGKRAYEKDETLVEIYSVNGIDHYIYENNGRVSITWYTDVFECSLRADITVEEAKSMVDSIYERQ